jgi:uncharacterized protein YdaU (DUF1376 family)
VNYYQFHIADFALHTSHLSLEEECIYRRLLDYYYDTESPIPEKTDLVIRRLRLKGYEDSVALILNEFFVLQADGWHNLRADSEISEYNKKADRARENGKKGGRPKKNKGLKTQPVISWNPEETGSKANQEPRTINHNTDPNGSVVGKGIPAPCPHQEIISLYHEALPMGTAVRVWNSEREKNLRARWRENQKRQSLDWWKKFFEYVSQSEFLTGQAAPAQQGRDPFVVSLDWLINPQNFAKVVEGKYHQRGAA